jgi:hypothetical protein
MMRYTFHHYYIRENMMESLTRYIAQGCPVGDFLSAVLANDLSDAVGRADDENMANLPAYVAYLYNEAPPACRGSREAVRSWITKFAEERDQLARKAGNT